MMLLISVSLLIFTGSNLVFAVNKEDPGMRCIAENSGKTVVVNDLEENERALICLKHDGKYHWKELDNNPSVGEFYNPGKDCTDIVRRRRSAKTGSYWINGLGLNTTLKVWCDVKTDKGGFMLVGNKNSPISWTVPSNSQIVTPNGPPHWSSDFGDVPMIEFRVQVSTTNDPKDVKADWLYHFTNPRPFTKLFVSESGSGCRNHFPGIGHVAFVKDLLVGKVVTRNFQCSRFGPAYPAGLGWQMMNYCLKTPCSSGYAVISGINLRYDKYGGFGFSTSFPRSGIQHNSTAFVGCDNEKCCFCYGPKGSVGDHCSPGCKSINGGRVTKAAYVWFWIRTSIPPSPVWKKCAEFKMRMEDGNNETYFIHPVTGVAKKGTCSKNSVPKFIDGIVDVENSEELENLPNVQGLLSYRNDDKKLYVANGDGWDVLGREIVEKNLSRQLSKDKKQLTSELKLVRQGTEVLKNELKFVRQEAGVLKNETSRGIVRGLR
ncbi:uncharacterized protein LOC114516957 isoform X2 [Dendronephthya gigantea]|uniref:uncharacterized protein LOC114516957 isoform X2 n=1 Tax=Dendronephthya gigantea TaxID=151771 RepID=UPI0010690711|nr:uncharacterized protein LOC114516957 isoform X2 [Dendronephthya gigantea]